MALYQLAGNFTPEAQRRYIQEFSTTKSALWRSGVVVTDNKLTQELNVIGGNVFNHPFNQPVEDDVATDTDDSETLITTAKMDSSTEQAVKQAKAYAWKASKFAMEMQKNDATRAVSDKVGLFWINNYQGAMLAALEGVELDNVANDASDMVHDVFEDSATPTTGLIDHEVFVTARNTMGDSWGSLRAIAMHSGTRARLMIDEANSFIPASETNIGFDTYNGMVIIEDDSMPVSTTPVNADEYTTYLFGPGAFAYANSNQLVPQVIVQDEKEGKGAGSETLITRRDFILHPVGFDALPAAATTPLTLAHQKLATTWDRKASDRKQVVTAIIKHNI